MKMIKGCLIVCLAVFALETRVSAADQKGTYGKAGGFELSTGLSLWNTHNGHSQQQYSIGVIPYANHFIFDNWFLQYSFGLVYQYSIYYYQYASGYSESTQFSILPGLGIGYSLALHERWRLNVSGGYHFNYTWSNYTYFGSMGSGNGDIVFSPELKYLATDRWILTLLMRVDTNLINLIGGVASYPAISTNAYIVVSYYF